MRLWEELGKSCMSFVCLRFFLPQAVQLSAETYFKNPSMVDCGDIFIFACRFVDESGLQSAPKEPVVSDYVKIYTSKAEMSPRVLEDQYQLGVEVEKVFFLHVRTFQHTRSTDGDLIASW